MSYYAVYRNDGQGWWYTIPDLDTIGIADDLDDARNMAREGVMLGVQWRIEDGEPIPEPTPREVIEESEKSENNSKEWFVELVEIE